MGLIRASLDDLLNNKAVNKRRERWEFKQKHGVLELHISRPHWTYHDDSIGFLSLETYDGVDDAGFTLEGKEAIVSAITSLLQGIHADPRTGADISHIEHLVDEKKANWQAFSRGCYCKTDKAVK